MARVVDRGSLGGLVLAAVLVSAAGSAAAAPVYSCDGFALAGGAELLCSHLDARAPAQVCTFSWTLLSATNGASVVNGSFLLAPGVANAIVYQGYGFASALSPPVVLCQGRRADPTRT